MNVTISPRALADAVSLTGYDEATAARHVIDAYHRAIRTSVTGYSVDCWLLTVRDGVIQRIRQHRVKIGDIYVSYHAIDRANERFRVPKDNAVEWLVDQFNRATFIAVTQDGKGNLGRTYAVDGVIIGMDMREPVIKTVYPACVASLNLYRRLEWLTRLELRKAALKLRIARALRLPTDRIEQMSREFKHIARSLPVHSKIAR